MVIFPSKSTSDKKKNILFTGFNRQATSDGYDDATKVVNRMATVQCLTKKKQLPLTIPQNSWPVLALPGLSAQPYDLDLTKMEAYQIGSCFSFDRMLLRPLV